MVDVVHVEGGMWRLGMMLVAMWRTWDVHVGWDGLGLGSTALLKVLVTYVARAGLAARHPHPCLTQWQ